MKLQVIFLAQILYLCDRLTKAALEFILQFVQYLWYKWSDKQLLLNSPLVGVVLPQIHPVQSTSENFINSSFLLVDLSAKISCWANPEDDLLFSQCALLMLFSFAEIIPMVASPSQKKKKNLSIDQPVYILVTHFN